MSNRKFFAFFCSVSLLMMLFTGCVSQEAQAVIDEIDALGAITLESHEKIQAIYAKYDALTDDDKADVKNLDVLETAKQKYTELYCADLDSRISEACNDTSSDNLPNLEALLEEYEQLEEEKQSKITNYTLLIDSIEESKVRLAVEVTIEILAYANGSNSTAKEMLVEYHEIMTDAQIEECLIEIGRWAAVKEAESYLKNYLKNPNSYAMYSGKCGEPQLQSGGIYKTYIYLDYGAENSFGGSVRNEVEMYVYFTIDPSSLTIHFTKTEFTPYYQWKFS